MKLLSTTRAFAVRKRWRQLILSFGVEVLFYLGWLMRPSGIIAVGLCALGRVPGLDRFFSGCLVLGYNPFKEYRRFWEQHLELMCFFRVRTVTMEGQKFEVPEDPS